MNKKENKKEKSKKIKIIHKKDKSENSKLNINLNIVIGMLIIVFISTIIMLIYNYIISSKKENINTSIPTDLNELLTNSENATNYKLLFNIVISDVCGVEYNFLIDNNYQKIVERSYTESDSITSNYFADYETKKLYLLNDFGDTTMDNGAVQDIKYIFNVMKSCNDRVEHEDGTYSCTIGIEDAKNSVYVMLNKLQEFGIDIGTYDKDIPVSFSLENGFVNLIDFKIGDITFKYNFSDYGKSDELSIPKLREMQTFGDENGVVYATEDE